MSEQRHISFGSVEFSPPDHDDECCVEVDDHDGGLRRWLRRSEMQELADWLRDVWGITGKEPTK